MVGNNRIFICSKHFEESEESKSLNTDMWKRDRIQQNLQTILHIFQKRSLLKDFFRFLKRKREEFSSKIRKNKAEWIGSKTVRAINDICRYLNESLFVELPCAHKTSLRHLQFALKLPFLDKTYIRVLVIW